MEETSRPGLIKTNGPRMLPMVTLSDGETYFIDERLQELRNIRDPFDRISLDKDKIILKDVEAIQKHFDEYTQFVNITCSKCKKTLFNGTEEEAKRMIIYCTDCN